MLHFSQDDAATLIDQHRQELLRHLMRRVDCPDTANDLLQDIFFRLVNYRSSEPVSNPRAFVYRIADNIATDHLRKNKVVLVGLQEPDGEAADLIDPSPSPEQVALSQQQLDRCEQALTALSPQTFNIFLLSRYAGYTHSQIAEKLGISVSWVEKCMMTALKHLKNTLNKDDF
jgi:RNA polymerase sigma factor (sigma-70 family)